MNNAIIALIKSNKPLAASNLKNHLNGVDMNLIIYRIKSKKNNFKSFKVSYNEFIIV